VALERQRCRRQALRMRKQLVEPKDMHTFDAKRGSNRQLDLVNALMNTVDQLYKLIKTL
jgi:hypothetical protein